MISDEILSDEIDSALQASVEILECIKQGDLEKVKLLNNVRMKFIRMLSMCQKTESLWQKFGNKLNQLKELDQQIMACSEQLRDDLMTQIRQNQENKNGCIQYKEQQLQGSI